MTFEVCKRQRLHGTRPAITPPNGISVLHAPTYAPVRGHGYHPPARPNTLFAIGGFGNAYLTIAAIATTLFFYAFIADLLGPAGEGIRLSAIIVSAFVAMLGATICVFRGLFLPALVSFISMLAIFASLYIFSINSGVPFTFNSGGEYVGIAFTGLFYLTLHDRTFGRLLNWFFNLCIGYALFYILASLALRFGYLDTGGVTRGIASADDAGRSDRLHSAALLLVYGTTYTIVKIRTNFRLLHTIWAAIFALAWWLTESRAIVVVSIPVIVAYLILPKAELIGRLAFSVFMVGVIASLIILIEPNWNPYLYFGDQSASVRTNSIDIASQRVWEYLGTGAGISFGIEGYRPISGITYFYPVDIGLIGILFMYGILGFLVYILICFLGCTSYKRIVSLGYTSDMASAVVLTAIILSAYSLQTPIYNGGSSGVLFATMFFAIALAYSATYRAMNRRHLAARSNSPAKKFCETAS
ncbi:hypothetical protein [Blastomonas natatoria]|uniref:hypothetical protein n=1 Tax=Blastomonas natatoria TaxID=34015 RepID=UPI0011B626B9|nr:hypothetical protein [Blastomonas natatoria]